MKEVSIYIATSIQGRWARNGHIGYVLEYYPENSKCPRLCKGMEPVENMNENSSVMEALIRAMSRMKEKCVLSIYTESEYLYNGFAGEEFVNKWIKSDWKTTRGTQVKNRDKWQALISGLQGNLYTFYLKEINAYTNTLKYELTQRERTI